MSKSLQKILDSGVSSPENGVFVADDIFNDSDDHAHYIGCLKLMKYWQKHVTKDPLFNPALESYALILLDSNYRITGHAFISIPVFSGDKSLAKHIFLTASKAQVPYVILMCKHQTGQYAFLKEDYRLMRAIKSLRQKFGVILLDYICLGGQKNCSFNYQTERLRLVWP